MSRLAQYNMVKQNLGYYYYYASIYASQNCPNIDVAIFATSLYPFIHSTSAKRIWLLLQFSCAFRCNVIIMRYYNLKPKLNTSLS